MTWIVRPDEVAKWQFSHEFDGVEPGAVQSSLLALRRIEKAIETLD
jgi:hypothetical protein